MIHHKTIGLLAFILAQSTSFASDRVQFPDDFLWCVSTAAHQIEGNNFNSDWWQWEQKPGNRSSAKATDHWNRVEEDTELLRDVGAKAYRFSIEWARIEPAEGMIDLDVIAHYRKEVDLIQAAGVVPIITLQHFTFPNWVAERGGWKWEGMPEAFEKYAEIVATQIAPHARYFATVNEPMNYTLGAYYTGDVPPGATGSLNNIIPALEGILKAHSRAYHMLHRIGDLNHQQIDVGMALQLRIMAAKNPWNPLDQIAASFAYKLFNWSLPDAMTRGKLSMSLPGLLSVKKVFEGLEATQDYVGINYYGGDKIEFSWTQGMIRSAWPGDSHGPEDNTSKGFYKVVSDASKRYPGKPILILENGTMGGGLDDQYRIEFLKEHLTALNQAIRDGAPVKSYCHWTFYDSVEWNAAQSAQMGLYETNYETFERIPRLSAKFFKSASSSNGFER